MKKENNLLEKEKKLIKEEKKLEKKEKKLIEKEKSFIREEFELIKEELRIIYNFKYPKLAGLVVAIIAAYFLFSDPKVGAFMSQLGSWGLIGVFIAGLFFTFGFTTPFAIGFFLTLNPESIWLAGILGGFGALLGDLIIFKFARFSFMDEFKRLEHTKLIRSVSDLIDKTFGHKIKVYLLYTFAGIIIASPLPDEAGVIMLAGLTKIKTSVLALISFTFNTIGILIVLSL